MIPRGSNDERLTDVGRNEVVSMSVSILSLLPHGIIGVTAHWLISFSSLHPTPFLPHDHASWITCVCRCSCIPTCATVDCFPEHCRQNRDSNPHCMIICFTSHLAIMVHRMSHRECNNYNNVGPSHVCVCVHVITVVTGELVHT